MERSEFKIVVCGGGLAGQMTVAALVQALRAPYKVVHIDDRAGTQSELLYGSVTAPTAYDFLLTLGLDEQLLFTKTNTSFSFGSQYLNWPSAPRDWVQAHHQPFALIGGVPLPHHLTRLRQKLGTLLISGEAARHGRFAHPPEDKAHPLSRAEYGYQFDSDAWSDALRRQLAGGNVERIAGTLDAVETRDDAITGLRLTDGQWITGDLYIDCTGPHRQLLQALDIAFASERTIAVRREVQTVSQLGPACRRIEASAAGWSAQTFLQNSVHVLTVSGAQDGSGSRYTVGRVAQAWTGNCLGIGLSASLHDPVSPAPMVMLQRDIERLMSLIPVSDEISMERNEFNRRFAADYANVSMFGAAFYSNDAPTEDPFWTEALAAAQSPDLRRKRTQFESRGVLVKYDLEPFNDEDWAILFLGLGILPSRYDQQADVLTREETAQHLETMRRTVSNVVPRMPPHHVYVANMKRYFEKQKYA
ncbi:MAG: tryptophan 7-halogenase [Pseudomonadota bacterium]